MSYNEKIFFRQSIPFSLFKLIPEGCFVSSDMMRKPKMFITFLLNKTYLLNILWFIECLHLFTVDECIRLKRSSQSLDLFSRLAQMERSNGSLPTDSSSATGSMYVIMHASFFFFFFLTQWKLNFYSLVCTKLL